jgi:17beta-estradiol 17-dehydrogenase / very-long-chain 3-oxoacyl-CoA reductase
VKTKIIAVDFGMSREIYDVIRKELEPLDVGILVNNVGRFHDYPDTLDKISEDLIWDVININIGAVTILSRMIIPKMKQKRKGIIVNVSSGTEIQPLPLATVYGASKTFNKYFTLGLQTISIS